MLMFYVYFMFRVTVRMCVLIRVQTAYTLKDKELNTHLLQFTPNATAYFAAHLNF
jgi:hypothetical protein